MNVSTQDILSHRPRKNTVDPWRPYHFLVEPEFSASRCVEDVATIFLTNRECPFTCLMCDLWKNTTDTTVPSGAIPAQIEYALRRLPAATHVKLYNSGNFFDAKAIPRDDWTAIAARVCAFDTVVVENHPKLCDERCVEFQRLLRDERRRRDAGPLTPALSPGPGERGHITDSVTLTSASRGGERGRGRAELEIAMGLETSHEATLATLNKQMTTADFACACEFLLSHGIRIRAFVLLRPPGVTEEQGVEQAIESVRFAFDCGVDCVAVIPTRGGNGMMDHLATSGGFHSPTLRSLEYVIDEALSWNRGRVFADLWDVEQFATCQSCRDARIRRMAAMNLTQQPTDAVACARCCG